MALPPTGSNRGIRLDTKMVARGAAFALIGSFFMGIGLLIGGSALVSAVQEWIRNLETPPSETFKRTAQQLRTAAVAGTQGWNNGTPESIENVVGSPAS